MRKTGVSSPSSSRFFRDDSCRQKIARTRKVTHRFIYEQSYRWKSFITTRSPLRRTASIYRYVKHREAGSPAATSESAVRLRTCHSCHEVINKRHPVPSPTLRDWSTVNVDSTPSLIYRVFYTSGPTPREEPKSQNNVSLISLWLNQTKIWQSWSIQCQIDFILTFCSPWVSPDIQYTTCSL